MAASPGGSGVRQTPAREEKPLEQQWFVLWDSEDRALLMSEAGQFMVFPNPGRLFKA